jgi:hypothetical protein
MTGESLLTSILLRLKHKSNSFQMKLPHILGAVELILGRIPGEYSVVVKGRMKEEPDIVNYLTSKEGHLKETAATAATVTTRATTENPQPPELQQLEAVGADLTTKA